jgi:phosphoribosylformimino-5-aminoimidazole carboxamide ribotide isomerase
VTIIPAIDILDGECVQLRQGDYDEATVYDKDPVAMARRFADAGARRIHLVDLDAARGDRRINRKAIRKIRKAVDSTIQLGGGIRSDDDIEELLDLGIDRLVVGTVLARKPDIVAGWTAHYGAIFLAGIDAMEGSVRISGWEQATKLSDVELASRCRELGLAGVIYTSIGRDGTLTGPDIDRTNAIADACRLPVVLSGGIGTAADIEAVRQRSVEGVVGVIAGTAIYEGRVRIEELLSDPEAAGVDVMEW